MNASRRPPKKLQPRPVAEGAGAAVRKAMGEPSEGNFAEGVQAHIEHRKRMSSETEGACDLGPWVPLPADDHADAAVGLESGVTRTIRFPPFWWRWFSDQTERTLRILDKIIAWLDAHGEEDAEARLNDLDEMILHHRNRRKTLARLRWAATRGGPIVGISWGAVTFFSDAIGRFIEQLPILRGVWKAIMGSA